MFLNRPTLWKLKHWRNLLPNLRDGWGASERVIQCKSIYYDVQVKSLIVFSKLENYCLTKVKHLTIN